MYEYSGEGEDLAVTAKLEFGCSVLIDNLYD
jgi:hypothetical protein